MWSSKVWAGDRNLEINCVYLAFEAMRPDELTKGTN